ncbi:MAG: hypothetical protein ACI8V2_000327 [Candidatus Latescibacterota bacterium]|jgi:hypothetical protein
MIVANWAKWTRCKIVVPGKKEVAFKQSPFFIVPIRLWKVKIEVWI